VELLGPDSQRVALSSLRTAAPDSTRVLVADIVGPLRAGRYRILWQITSADGHPVRGTVGFQIATDATGLAISPMDSAATAALPPAPVSSSNRGEPAGEAPATFAVDSWQYAMIRLLTFSAIVVVIGAVAFALIVIPGARHRLPDLDASFVLEARRRAAYVALGATAALAVLLVARLVAQSYAVGGTFPDADFMIGASRTAWGAGLVLAAASVLVLAIVLRRTRNAAWTLAAAGATGLALATALSGHAAASGRWTFVAVASDTVHILAAGGWLGALLLVLVAGVPAAAALPSLGRGTAVRSMVEVFSPMALMFAGALGVTGVIAAVLRIGTWSALTGTDYGRLLLLKIGALVLVLIMGGYNWRRLRPSLNAERVGTLRRTAAAELFLGFIVLVVTAWLVATPPPGE
jgi:putative copper export protein